jgi:hypothetical protein
MEVRLFQNVIGGIVQDQTPVRVVDGEFAYDVSKIEVINGVVYLRTSTVPRPVHPELWPDDHG